MADVIQGRTPGRATWTAERGSAGTVQIERWLGLAYLYSVTFVQADGEDRKLSDERLVQWPFPRTSAGVKRTHLMPGQWPGSKQKWSRIPVRGKGVPANGRTAAHAQGIGQRRAIRRRTAHELRGGACCSGI